MEVCDLDRLSDEDFRAEVRAFFEAHYPQHLRFILRRVRWSEIKEWYLTLSKHGWIAPNWPREMGGMGLSANKMLILLDEQERFGVARPPDHGIIQVGPIIIRFGNEQQKRYYLPKILSGEHIWAQAYSEPDAGSDLASLRTMAVVDGEHLVVDGQKIWSTLAHDATHLYTLVRTSREGRKQQGISFLLIDAHSPGVIIRPIRNIAGHEEFCEIFFDRVRAPLANVVGGLNNGWTVAKALLSFERISIGSPRRAQYALGCVEAIGRANGLLSDRGFVDKFAALKLDMEDLTSLYARYVEILRQGGEPGPEVAMLKIWATESWQRLTDLLVETAQEYGSVPGQLAIDGTMLDVLTPFYYARPGTIYGGTSEVLRNVVAKRVLGLPV